VNVRSVNDSSASVKNKVAVNRAAVSKADDKTGFSGTKRAAGGQSGRFFIYVQTCV
jgi:hypothetical protein